MRHALRPNHGFGGWVQGQNVSVYLEVHEAYMRCIRGYNRIMHMSSHKAGQSGINHAIIHTQKPTRISTYTHIRTVYTCT